MNPISEGQDMPIQPRNDYVLIERIDKPRKGLVIVPDIGEERGIKGLVLSVGPGKRDEDGDLIPMESKAGDMVLFNSRWNDLGDNHETVNYRYNGKMHLVQEGDIYCRIPS